MDYPEQYPIPDSPCLYLLVPFFLTLQLLVQLPFAIFLLILFVAFPPLHFLVILLLFSVVVTLLPPFFFEPFILVAWHCLPAVAVVLWCCYFLFLLWL